MSTRTPARQRKLHERHAANSLQQARVYADMAAALRQALHPGASDLTTETYEIEVARFESLYKEFLEDSQYEAAQAQAIETTGEYGDA